MPKCATCNQTAPENPPCPHGQCGACCNRAPPCSEDVHCKLRRTVRGKRSKKTKETKVRCWKEAYRRCRPLLKQQRARSIGRVLGVSVAQLRAATLRALLAQARDEISQQSAGPVEMPADTSTELSVALLAPPKQTQEVVHEMLATDDLRDFIDQGEFDKPDCEAPATWSDDEEEGEPSSLPTLAETASGPSQASVDVPATATWLGGLEPGASSSSQAQAAEPAAVTSTTQTLPASSSAVQNTDGPLEPAAEEPKPWLVYNKEGKPCAHWARASPPLADSLAKFDKLGYACHAPRTPFVMEDFLEFLKDFRCTDNLLPPTQEPLIWTSDNDDASNLGALLHAPGTWYRFGFEQPQQKPLDGTDTSNRNVWKHSWAQYTRCLHSTNLYVLPKTLREGLEPGPWPGKGNRYGVYCFPMTRVKWSVMSSGYCVYTAPRGDGWFIGPRIEMQVAMGLSHQTPIAVGAHQYCAWRGCYSATALWIHVIHEDDLRAAYSQEVALHYYVDKWRPEFMVP